MDGISNLFCRPLPQICAYQLSPNALKVNLLVLGLLLLGGGIATHFLHVNAIATYALVGTGGLSLFSIVLISVAKTLPHAQSKQKTDLNVSIEPDFSSTETSNVANLSITSEDPSTANNQSTTPSEPLTKTFSSKKSSNRRTVAPLSNDNRVSDFEIGEENHRVHIPFEAWEHIFSFLGISDIITCSKVCFALHLWTSSDPVWKPLYKQDFSLDTLPISYTSWKKVYDDYSLMWASTPTYKTIKNKSSIEFIYFYNNKIVTFDKAGYFKIWNPDAIKKRVWLGQFGQINACDAHDNLLVFATSQGIMMGLNLDDRSVTNFLNYNTLIFTIHLDQNWIFSSQGALIDAIDRKSPKKTAFSLKSSDQQGLPIRILRIQDQCLFGGTDNGTIYKWDITSQSLLTVISNNERMFDFQIQRDWLIGIFTEGRPKIQEIHSNITGPLFPFWENKDADNCITFLRVHHKFIFCAQRMGPILIYDRRKMHSPYSIIKKDSNYVNAMYISGNKLITGSENGVIQITEFPSRTLNQNASGLT